MKWNWSAWLLLASVAHAQDKSRVLFSILTPIKITDANDKSLTVDLQGRSEDIPTGTILGDPVKVDTSVADLELRLWKVHDTYNFESIIDVKGVNQSMLPTDEHGRILKEAKSLTDRPFIRYFLPGRDPITIDINCNKKRCRALWPNIPYEPVKIQNFQVEVNIRGLRGKHWQAGFNQTTFLTQPIFTFPDARGTPQRVSLFSPAVDWPSTKITPLQRDTVQVESVEDWVFQGKETTGYRRIRNLTRFGIVKGKMMLEITNGDFIERREVVENQVLWLLPAQVVKLTNMGSETRVIRVEFVANSR